MCFKYGTDKFMLALLGELKRIDTYYKICYNIDKYK